MQPPPEWLTKALGELKMHYPDGQFEGLMKHCPVNMRTGKLVMPAPAAGTPLPDDVRYMFLPRVKCLDCPGKLYTPGPDTTVGNFEIHVKNSKHIERVRARLEAERGGGSARSSADS